MSVPPEKLTGITDMCHEWQILKYVQKGSYNPYWDHCSSYLNL